MNAAEVGCYLRDPAWFWLLGLLAVVAGRVLWCRPRLAIAALPDGARSPRTWRQSFVWLPAWLEAAALVLGVVAFARPVQQLAAPPERLVRDVMLCLDRSSSMAREDLAPARSRLQLAVEMATALVEVRPDDRFGCVGFARYPDLVCPPTLDHAAAQHLLAGLELVAADGPEDATGIGGAVGVAASVLERSPRPGRVIVLLTDGEENVATDGNPDAIAPVHAAQLCAQLGIRVHTIVVGRGVAGAGHGQVPSDTTAVQQLAAATGGRFFAAGEAAALRQIGGEIDALEAVAFAEPRLLVREWFAAALGAAVALMGLAHVLRRTWLQVVP
jgi:Ca-activated chloride channel family protein